MTGMWKRYRLRRSKEEESLLQENGRSYQLAEINKQTNGVLHNQGGKPRKETVAKKKTFGKKTGILNEAALTKIELAEEEDHDSIKPADEYYASTERLLKQSSSRKSSRAASLKSAKLPNKSANIPPTMENIGEYLDQKVIDEMINIKSVDQTIDDILTISEEEIDLILDCGTDKIQELITPDLTSLSYVHSDKGDDAHCQLYDGSHLSLEPQLDVEYFSVGEMEEILTIGEEFLKFDVSEEAMRVMLGTKNTDFTEVETFSKEIDDIDQGKFTTEKTDGSNDMTDEKYSPPVNHLGQIK